jgi:hypothetical protein
MLSKIILIQSMALLVCIGRIKDKDIQKQMQKQEPKYISLRFFFDWAISKIDINQHPDLMELQGIIKQL